MREYYRYDGHFIPQHEYIYNNHNPTQQKRIIILRNERLHADFACLKMKQFGTSHMELPPEHLNVALGTLTEANLTIETKRLIEEITKRILNCLGIPKHRDYPTGSSSSSSRILFAGRALRLAKW